LNENKGRKIGSDGIPGVLKSSFKIIRHKLDNGLELVLIPISKVPIISINLAYKVGSKDEKPGMTGFAHLFEHLMFEGSKNIPNGFFDKYCSIAGGNNNAYTTYDYTSYVMTLPSHQLDLGLWLESDRMFFFDINKESLDKQKNIVIEEIKQNVENRPYGKWRDLLAKSAFDKRCSYSWEVYGKAGDIRSSKVEDVQKFYDDYYRPDNACLVLCGDINVQQSIKSVEKYFNLKKQTQDIRHKTQDSKEFNSNYLKKGIEASFKDNVPFNAVFLAFHCSGFKSDDIFTVELISNILGDGKSSRLYRSLVYDLQIASDVGAFVDKREHSSLLTFYAVANDSSTDNDKLYKTLINELLKFVETGIEIKELEKAKNQLTSSLAYDLQHSSGIADIVGFQTLFWNEPGRIFSILNNYLKIQKNDVDELLKNIITPTGAIRIDAIPKKQK
jgi:zinc protease